MWLHVDLFHALHLDVVVATCLTAVTSLKSDVYQVKTSTLVERVLPEQSQQVACCFIEVTCLP